VIGFAYAVIVEALLTAFLGPYVPVILISGAMFVAGVISDANTITDQDHWFVFGVIFISVFIDLISLILAVVFLVGGYLLRRYLDTR
jgi:large-conductance mechanosensitive channel